MYVMLCKAGSLYQRLKYSFYDIAVGKLLWLLDHSGAMAFSTQS